jgi:hypothetical protein
MSFVFQLFQFDTHLSIQISHRFVTMTVDIVIEILINQIEEVLIDHLHLTSIFYLFNFNE